MRPRDIQIIGEEIAIKWENGEESFLKLAKLENPALAPAAKGKWMSWERYIKDQTVHINSLLFESNPLNTLADMPFSPLGKTSTIRACFLLITSVLWPIHLEMNSHK